MREDEARSGQLVVVGDSMTRAFEDVATHSWSDLVSIAVSAAGENAPGEGFQGLWREEWTRRGTWTMSKRSDAFDVAPFGWVLSSSGDKGDELTWTKPRQVSVAAFDLYVVDECRAGDWLYRVDNGPWNRAGPPTDATINRLRRVFVDTPVNERVQVIGSNGREPCVAALAGIDVYLDAANARERRTHDLSAGMHFLSQFCRPTAGDPLALFDELQPQLVIVAFSNDVLFRAPVKFEAALRLIVERVAPFGDALLIAPYEQRPPRVVQDAELTQGSCVVASDSAAFLPSDVGERLLSPALADDRDTVIASVQSSREATMSQPARVASRDAEMTIGFRRTTDDQAQYRAITRDVAASTGSPFLDIYDAWSKVGATGWDEAFEAGLMIDRYHASAAGHRDIAARLLDLVAPSL